MLTTFCNGNDDAIVHNRTYPQQSTLRLFLNPPQIMPMNINKTTIYHCKLILFFVYIYLPVNYYFHEPH